MKKYQVWIFEDLHRENDHTFIFEGTLAEMQEYFPVTKYSLEGWVEMDVDGYEVYRSYFFMEMKEVWVIDDYPVRIDENLMSGYWEKQWRRCEDPRVK